MLSAEPAYDCLPQLAPAQRCLLLTAAWLRTAGPPGTGKTTAVIELICQEAARGR